MGVGAVVPPPLEGGVVAGGVVAGGVFAPVADGEALPPHAIMIETSARAAKKRSTARVRRRIVDSARGEWLLEEMRRSSAHVVYVVNKREG